MGSKFALCTSITWWPQRPTISAKVLLCISVGSGAILSNIILIFLGKQSDNNALKSLDILKWINFSSNLSLCNEASHNKYFSYWTVTSIFEFGLKDMLFIVNVLVALRNEFSWEISSPSITTFDEIGLVIPNHNYLM